MCSIIDNMHSILCFKVFLNPAYNYNLHGQYRVACDSAFSVGNRVGFSVFMALLLPEHNDHS